MAVDFTTMYGYLVSGAFFTFFSALFNSYMPWGIGWFLMGITLFIVVQIKSSNMGYAGMVSTIWFVGIFSVPNLVTNAFGVFWIKLFGTILGLAVIFFYLYRLIKS